MKSVRSLFPSFLLSITVIHSNCYFSYFFLCYLITILSGGPQAFIKEMFADVLNYRPNFGTCPNASTFDPQGNEKRLAILSDPLNPINIYDEKSNVIDYELFLYVLANQLQEKCLLRGRQEPSCLTPDDFEWGITTAGFFQGLPFVKLKSSHSGQKQLAMDLQNHSRAAVSSTIDHLPIARTSNCPYSLYNMMHKYTQELYPPKHLFKDPTCRRLFQRKASKQQITQWRSEGHSWMASTVNPWGPKMFNLASTRHAEKFGHTNAKRCTAHGSRKKGTTIIHSTDGVGVSTKLAITRHKHIETGAFYDKGTLMGRDKAQAALHGIVYDGTRSDYVDQKLQPIDRKRSPVPGPIHSTKKQSSSAVHFQDTVSHSPSRTLGA